MTSVVENAHDWGRSDHNHHRPTSHGKWLSSVDLDDKRPNRSPAAPRSLSRPPAPLANNGRDLGIAIPAPNHNLPAPRSPGHPGRPPPPYSPPISLDMSPMSLRTGNRLAARLSRSVNSQPFWLVLYFFFNLSLTLYNKGVLVKFPFPYTLTALHALCGSIGSYVLLEQGYYVPARLSQRENVTLLCFSVLYTINIAVSNLSLQLVTVPFHQVVRASTPLFTIAISVVLMRVRLNTQKLATLLPVIVGVGFATYGDYYFTAWGLFLTLLGTFLASLKTVITNMLQSPSTGSRGVKLHPLDLLLRMSPLAFIQCVVFGWYTGELERVRRFGALEMTWLRALALLINGIIAFGLNVVSFTANKKSGPLTMTVAANVKQVLTILLAVMIFHLHITSINGVGIFLTVAGGAWYAFIEYKEKSKRSAVATTARRMA